MTSEPRRTAQLTGRAPRGPVERRVRLDLSTAWLRCDNMTTKAKVVKNGNSQAVRIPKEFRFDSKEVEILPVSGGLLLRDPKKVRDFEKFLKGLKKSA